MIFSILNFLFAKQKYNRIKAICSKCYSTVLLRD